MHGRAHTGNKTDICDICKRGLTQKSNMLVHRNRHFKAIAQFYCEDCYESFNGHDTLISHKTSKEHQLTKFLKIRMEITCLVCNFSSCVIEEIINHGYTCSCIHSLVCKLCFNTQNLNFSDLREHARMHQNEICLNLSGMSRIAESSGL